jgi:[ribosomal protein S5]-alanine N-acetyltransferase
MQSKNYFARGGICLSKITLKGKRIYVENLIDKVTPGTIQYYLNDMEQSRYMHAVPYPYTIEDAQRYFKYLDYSRNDKTTYELGIFDNEQDTFIGVISLRTIDFNYQNAEIGYWLVKEFWKKGYATEAAELIIEYAFEKLDLYRIYATLEKDNVSSLSLLNRLGFEVEGLMKKSVKNKGKFVDRYICGFLRDKWNR